MSKLAADLSGVTPETTERVRRGPQSACQGRYPADLEDWVEVERIRKDTSWLAAQVTVDKKLGLTDKIHNDKFRYHWRRKCWCWPDEMRLA